MQQMIRELQQTTSHQQEKMEKFYKETGQTSITTNTTKTTEEVDEVKTNLAQVSTNGQTTNIPQNQEYARRKR